MYCFGSTEEDEKIPQHTEVTSFRNLFLGPATMLWSNVLVMGEEGLVYIGGTATQTMISPERDGGGLVSHS